MVVCGVFDLSFKNAEFMCENVCLLTLWQCLSWAADAGSTTVCSAVPSVLIVIMGFAKLNYTLVCHKDNYNFVINS